MTEGEKINALKHLSDIHRDQFNERRRYEWKAFLTLLTFYVLCVAGKYGTTNNFPDIDNTVFKILVVLVFIGVGILTSLFLAAVNMKNNINKGYAEQAERSIEKILKGEEHQPIHHPTPEERWITWKGAFKNHRNGMWSWAWQSVILLIFGISSAILVIL